MEGVAVGSLHRVDSPVLEDVNWTVKAGEYWVLAGFQGSGKTDFLMTAGGVMAPLRGRYELLRESMPIFDDARLSHRLRLGLVFDGGQLFNHLTVRQNIALPLRYHHNLSAEQAKPQVDAWLEEMELGDAGDRTPGALGRNWQQRAGLARALILQPEVLLVDNPLSGLDLRHETWWLKFLDRLVEGHPLVGNRPVTLICTTSDLRPWRGPACLFAVVRHHRLNLIGAWERLDQQQRDLVLDLLPSSGVDAAGTI